MRARLIPRPRLRFSKTAWSRPRLRHAVRAPAEVGRPPAVGGRRGADDLAEDPAERAEAVEADLQADLGDAQVRLAKEEHRPLHATALQVSMRRLAEGRA